MGYTLGAEMLPNGTFDTQVTEWFPDNCTISWEEEDGNGRMKVVAPPSGALFNSPVYEAQLNEDFIAGEIYVVEYDIEVRNVPNNQIRDGQRCGVALRTGTGDAGVEVQQFTYSGEEPQHVRFEFQAAADYSGYMALLCGYHPDDTVAYYFDNVTLKHLIFDDTPVRVPTFYMQIVENTPSSVTLSGTDLVAITATNVSVPGPVYFRWDGTDAESAASGTYALPVAGSTARYRIDRSETVTISVVSPYAGYVMVGAQEAV